MSDSTIQATRPNERMVVLDVVRGFAISGILLVHILFFSGYVYTSFDVLEARSWHALDAKVFSAYEFAMRHKFYRLFALLFGVGYFLQGRRMTEEVFVSFYSRRMIILAGFGLLHSLFFYGDILLMYSILGLVMLSLRRFTGVLSVAIGIYMLGTAVDIAAYFTLSSPAPRGAWTPPLAYVSYPNMSAEEVLNVITGTSLVDFIRVNVNASFWNWRQALLSAKVFHVLGSFFIGYFIAANGWIQRGGSWRRAVVFVFTGAVIVYTTTRLVHPNVHALPPQPKDILGGALLSVGQLIWAFGYAECAAALYVLGVFRPLTSAFAAIGRCTITNYLGQTLICSLIFSGFGFGLAGRFGVIELAFIAVAIVAAQAAFSHWWLARFPFGPVEGLWRKLAYSWVNTRPA